MIDKATNTNVPKSVGLISILEVIILVVLFSSCGPNINNSDPIERGKAVRRITDQATLAKIATDDKSSHVRHIALYMLTDQVLLSKIALDPGNDEFLRRQAIEKITDIEVLATIAAEYESNRSAWSISRYAIERLEEQSLLEKISDLTDEVLLTKIAIAVDSPNVYKTAIGKINNQVLLAEIFHKARGTSTQEAAFDRITDQSLLNKIALDSKYYTSIRARSIRKLTDPDQATLAKIVKDLRGEKGFGSYEIAHAAVERISDQSILTNIALDSEYSHSIRSDAIRKLNDQATLAKIVFDSITESITEYERTGSYKSIIGSARDAAMDRLMDQDLLKKIVLESRLNDVSIDAVSKVTDQNFLVKIALDETLHTGIRKAAADKISEPILDKTLQARLEKVRLDLEEKIKKDPLLALGESRMTPIIMQSSIPQQQKEGIEVRGVQNGKLILRGTPIYTGEIIDGSLKQVLTQFLPKDSTLLSKSSDGREFKASVNSVTLSVEEHRIVEVYASVDGEEQGIIHSSSLRYDKINASNIKTADVIVKPIIDSKGELLTGQVLLTSGSTLPISLADGAHSMLAQPGSKVTLASQVMIDVDGKKIINNSDNLKKYTFVLNADGKLIAQEVN